MPAGYHESFSRVVVYLNPLIPVSHLVTCLNRDVVAHLVIYWLISISAVLLAGGTCCDACCSVDQSKQRDDGTDTKSSPTGTGRQRSASRSRQQTGEASGSRAQPSTKSNKQQRDELCTQEEQQQQLQQQQQQQQEMLQQQKQNKKKRTSTSDQQQQELQQQQQPQEEEEEEEEECQQLQQQLQQQQQQQQQQELQQQKQCKKKRTSPTDQQQQELQQQQQLPQQQSEKNNSSSGNQQQQQQNNQPVNDEEPDEQVMDNWTGQVNDDDACDDNAEEVKCGYELGPNDDNPHWLCRRVRRQRCDDDANRSANANDDDSLTNLLRALRLETASSTTTVDDDRLSTAESDMDDQLPMPPRRGSYEEDTRVKELQDCRRHTAGLIVNRSSTSDRRTTSADHWMWDSYHEDTCLEFNDNDERDKMPQVFRVAVPPTATCMALQGR